MTEKWYYVDVHYACYGIGAKNGVVFFAPPIAKWMIGKKLDDINTWLKKIKPAPRVIELDNSEFDHELFPKK